MNERKYRGSHNGTIIKSSFWKDIRDFLVAFSIAVALIALAYIGLSILAS